MLGPHHRSPLVLLLAIGCQPPVVEATSPTTPPPSDGSAKTAHGPNAHHDGRGHHPHHRFENADEWAEMFDDPARAQWQRPEEVIDYIAPPPDARIADLGAGTGYFSVRFAKRVPGGHVYANDIEPDMVRYLNERATTESLSNLVAVQGFTDNPAIPEPVDVAFMCNVFHHIEDPKAFFNHVIAQLRPGGRVVIIDFKKDAPDDVPGPPPAMRVAQEDLLAELATIGLAPIRSDRELLPHQYIVELRVDPR